MYSHATCLTSKNLIHKRRMVWHCDSCHCQTSELFDSNLPEYIRHRFELTFSWHLRWRRSFWADLYSWYEKTIADLIGVKLVLIFEAIVWTFWQEWVSLKKKKKLKFKQVSSKISNYDFICWSWIHIQMCEKEKTLLRVATPLLRCELLSYFRFAAISINIIIISLKRVLKRRVCET